MLSVAVLAAVLGQLPATEISKASRTLFEELAKFDIDKGRLVVELKNASPNVSTLRMRALELFPSVSRVRVQSQNGSTSTSRGGAGGEVAIRIGTGGGGSVISYHITTPSGEKVFLDQTANGVLKLEVESRGFHVSLEQTADKCTVRTRARGERLNATGKTLTAVFQSHPLQAREQVFGAIEHFFGKPPFLPLTAAPPGKTVIRLRDGSVIVGDIHLKEAVLETDYGRLTIPRKELFHIFFPGAGAIAGESGSSGSKTSDAAPAEEKTLVITPRFTPRGRIDLDKVELTTPYGELELATDDILHIAFGAVKEDEAEKAEGTGESASAVLKVSSGEEP